MMYVEFKIPHAHFSSYDATMRRKISAFQVKHRVLSMVPTTWIWFLHAHYFEIDHVGTEHSETKSLALGARGLAKILLWSRQASLWRQRPRLLITNRRNDLSNTIIEKEGGMWMGTEERERPPFLISHLMENSPCGMHDLWSWSSLYPLAQLHM